MRIILERIKQRGPVAAALGIQELRILYGQLFGAHILLLDEQRVRPNTG